MFNIVCEASFVLSAGPLVLSYNLHQVSHTHTGREQPTPLYDDRDIPSAVETPISHKATPGSVKP